MGNSESSIRASLENKPTVVVIGGGFGGIELAQHLDRHFNVIVIDRKNYFFVSFAALRATVNESFARRVAIPYSKALRFGHVVQAEVERISPEGVKVRGKDDLIKFDYLVISTGTSYAFPAKVASPDAKDIPGLYAEIRTAVEKAQNILVIGGGVVGVELLGELTNQFPEKKYTLLHSHEQLIPGPLKKEFQSQFLKLVEGTPNVKLILGDRAVLEDDELKTTAKFLEGKRIVKTEKGQEVETDLIFFCTGAKVNNASFKDQFPVDEDGRLKVNKFLQVEGHENIFAIGDCANFPEGKLGFSARLQGTDAAKNIIAHSEKRPLKERIPLSPGMFVPFGPKKGFGQFPNESGTIVGSFATSMIKGKTLFAPAVWSQLNQKMTDAEELEFSTHVERENEKLRRFSSVFKMDEEQMKKLLDGLPAEPVEADHT